MRIIDSPFQMEKLENTISAEDKLFCEKLNGIYTDMLDLLTTAHSQFKYDHDRMHSYIASNTSELVTAMIFEIEKTLDAMESNITSLTNRFVQKIENYFIEKYNLRFSSLVINERKPPAVDSYHTVVANIIDQLGEDILSQSKTNTIRGFRYYFRRRKNTPKALKKVVALPAIALWDRRLETLLYAVSLYLYGTTQLSPLMEGYKNRLGHNIGASDLQPLADDVQIRTYANGRVDLVFTSAEKAKGFFEYYDLANPSFID